MGGDETARYNLGNMEIEAGNADRAIKHLMIAVGSVNADSLQTIHNYTQMGMQQKIITQQHYNPIKHTWERLRVNRGMKLLLHEMIILIIRFGRGRSQQKIIQ